MNTLVSIENLTLSFSNGTQQIRALNQVTFQIKPGETLGIVGESGSGKSLTALSISRLLPPAVKIDTGSIIWYEKTGSINLLEADAQTMESLRGDKIGMVFQEPSTALNPVLTCGEQIVETLVKHRKISRETAKTWTRSLFETVKLPASDRFFRSYPHQLSGGQRQRVMIALGLCCHPKLLIADEPTTALDVRTQRGILDLLKELRQDEDLSILFISHDLDVVAEICERILVMQNGKIVEEGPVMQVIQNPKHPYTKALIDCKPRIHQQLSRLPTGQNVLRNSDIQSKQATNTAQIEQPGLSQEPLLQVENLNVVFSTGKHFGFFRNEKVKAVHNLSFEIRKGEILGIVGESGSGKTSLSRAILNLLDAQSGQVWFQGERILKFLPAQWKELRKKVQIIFQDPFSSLNPRLTIGQMLTEVIRFHGIASDLKEIEQICERLLLSVGLESDHFQRFPHEFSGGQRQRIGIARALAVRPELIICDECVSSLDVSIQAQILNLLKDLRDEFGLTYLFISHDMGVIRFMCNRVLVLESGKMVEIGNTEDVFTNPRKNYTRQLLEAIPDQKF